MKDIVEDALEHAEDLEDDDTTNLQEFGEPHVVLVGYGDIGAEITKRGWDSRYRQHKYSDADTHHIPGVEAVPTDVIDADYVILAGSPDDHSLAADIGATLADETTSVALPICSTVNPVSTIETVNATIPCPQTYIQELATDLLAIFGGQIEISPPPRFYHELQRIGLVHGFRGEQKRVRSDIPPDEFAEQLVSDALANPFDAGAINEHYSSFLHAGEELTLRESDAIRTEISNELGTDAERELLAVATTEDVEPTYRLTMICF